MLSLLLILFLWPCLLLLITLYLVVVNVFLRLLKGVDFVVAIFVVFVLVVVVIVNVVVVALLVVTGHIMFSCCQEMLI